jgi:hypothetical protein
VSCLLLALTGCNKIFNISDPVDDVDGGGVDDVSATTDARRCFGTELEVCLDPLPTDPIADLSGTLDTETSPSCLASVAAACVVAATDVTVPSGKTLQVTGSRPLVVIATGTLTIAGTLDASSHAVPVKAGPGALGATCNAFAATPSARGGGAGGSFAGLGGSGAGAITPTTGNGGEPPAVITTIEFRAGCPGQNSGGPTANRFGLGGLGGGAVYVMAGTAIDVSGSVTASGAPGTGGECTDASACLGGSGNAHGAGGGGSGGMIILEAPVVSVTGAVFADGGGGGEGSSSTINGNDGKVPDGNAAAPGGGLEAGAPSNGGNGGAGSHAAIAAANAEPGDDPGAGGGGGGGAGVIRLHGAPSIAGGGSVSPAP